jgi:uncharacterized protein
MISQTAKAHGLQASRDIASGECVFPPVPASSSSAHRYETIDLSAAGTLYAFTILHARPDSGKAPVTVGYVDYPEKARVFGKIILPEGQSPQIGMMLRPDMQDVEGGEFAFVPDEAQA